MPVSALRNHVSTQSVSTGLGSTATRGSVLIRITVQASKPKRAAAAANVLGDVVIADTTSPYVKKSIASLQRKLASYQKQLVSVGRLVDQYNATLKASSLAPFDKLILVNQVDNALLRQGNLNDKIATTDAQLTLAQNIEIAQIVSRGLRRQDHGALAPELDPGRGPDRPHRRGDRRDRHRLAPAPPATCLAPSASRIGRP